MPLGRSNTGRSKSRSPLPPSNYKQSLSPHPFQPPSHYAAAAGISYTVRPSHDTNSNKVDRSKLSIDAHGDPNDHYTTSFMPVTYPSDAESTSNSSFEFKCSSPGEEKQSVPNTTKTGRRGQRQSIINDLPQLEANLLPSLRDTIGRMTRSPSGAASTPFPVSHLKIPRPVGDARSSRSLSPSGAPTYNSSTTPYPEDYPTANPASFLDELSTPGPSYSSESTDATTADILTPRINLPAKPSLKGVLRPPTPKLFSKTSDHVPSTSGVSMKSVRSILKKTSIRNLTTSYDDGSSRNPTTNQHTKPLPVVPNLRSRSRTDPGSATEVSFEDQNSAPSPRAGYTAASDSKGRNRVQPSSIPRLQTKRIPSQFQWSADSESDCENRYEAEGLDHRQLVVANAELLPSSSESEVEIRERAHGRTGETDYRNNRRTSRQGIGLGLDLDLGVKKNRGSIVSQKETTSSSRRDSLTKSTRSTREPRTPARSSRSSESQSNKDPKHDRNLSNMADVSREHQRRRAALVEIISGRQPTAIEGESDTDYSGEDGFAISGSQDFAGELKQNHGRTYEQMYEVESEYEDEIPEVQRPTYPRKERPRSSSCTPMPTFLLSTNDDEHPTRGHPSSPRTAPQSERYLDPSQIPHPRAEKSRKSSSRSPVVLQIDTTAIPAALRRHSVYHRSSSPDPPPIRTSGDRTDRRKSDKRLSATNVSKPHRESSQQRRDAGDSSSRPYAAAARERKAYGIPPSDSIGAGLDRRSLPHTDSDLSSVGSVYWEDGSESELSPAAETLFRKLGGSQAKGDRRSYQSSVEKVQRPGASSRAASPSFAAPVINGRSQKGGSSPRREERRARFQLPSPSPPPIVTTTNHDENMETQRQGLILEIHQTEEAFVKRLQVFVHLFILPLRVQDSKNWISGVPSEVARLFDWLEDIVVLHSQILYSLESTRAAQHPTVERIAESIRSFIPRLEVYQPYLVKLGDAVALIDQLLQDEHSDFGEFIHIQETAPECEGWIFQDFLVEPVNLLAKFPEFFSRLLELTPKSHRDYLSTFSLVHSTDMFIRVMTEVKAREDEYDLIQRFATRIQGLAPSAQLATRERRILHSGVLTLIDVEENSSSASSGSTKIFRYFPPGCVPGGTNNANRTSKVMTAMNQWDAGRGRSGSASSSSTGMSTSSLRTTSSGVSPNAPSTPDSPFFSSFRIPMPKGRLNQTRGPMKIPASPSPAPRSSTPSHGMPVQAFIFTDLVLLAAPTSNPETDVWTLLKHIGTIRVLGVQLQEQDSHDTDTITVEALPVDPLKLNQTTNLDDDSVILLRLSVPKDSETPAHIDETSLESGPEESRRSWISALRRCHKFTLCSLSVPSRNYDPQLDAAFDRHQTVFSLLASGLPLPKSPSMQMADIRGGGEADDATTQERQERGWWSLRFQQVFRELQRQDLALASSVVDC